MATTTSSTHRTIVSLKLPTSKVAALVTYTQSIVRSTVSSPSFWRDGKRSHSFPVPGRRDGKRSHSLSVPARRDGKRSHSLHVPGRRNGKRSD
jgi:hypothetical protein